MKLPYKNPGIELPSNEHHPVIRNITSLLDVNLNIIEVKHDIILNIRVDGNQIADFLKSIIGESFSEDFKPCAQNNEAVVKELTSDKKDLKPRFWIDDENYLTCREVEIMENLSKGLLYKEIADFMSLSLNTVKNHLKKIYRKLGVGNRSEAIIGYMKIKDKLKKDSCDE